MCFFSLSRNLSVDGGPEVCDKMVVDDIMTPLVTLLKLVSTVEVPGAFSVKAFSRPKADDLN